MFPLLHPRDIPRMRQPHAEAASVEPSSAPFSTIPHALGSNPSPMDHTIPALPARHSSHLSHHHNFAEAYLVQRGQVPYPRNIGGRGKLSSSPPGEGRQAKC